ncbi:MAG: 6-carboxytetrahydropterin synthase QueD [Candidatus Omnitrophica bacterium]|nr:6-carboxytetrahydropterin synthase QueD [Candidatus Omnitrophota bacterium]
MYSVSVRGSFSSAHNLRAYKGKCEELHGHNWKVEVTVSCPQLDKTGMVIDFKILRTKLEKVLETLDHKYLNNIIYFRKVNPTSENIAKYIYNRLRSEFKGLQKVTVWESEDSCATYEPRPSFWVRNRDKGRPDEE